MAQASVTNIHREGTVLELTWKKRKVAERLLVDVDEYIAENP